jgi:hypothetical protein
VDATNSPVEAARAFHQALAEGNQVRLLNEATGMSAQAAWNDSFGRSGEAPLAWRDLYQNVYIDNNRVRVNDLVALSLDETPPNFDALPDLHPQAEPASGGAVRPRQEPWDDSAVVHAGEIRGVERAIQDPVEAARLFYEHRSQGRFVRFIRWRAELEHTWVNDYGGQGEPPPAWIDGRGYLVVDAERVDLPFSPDDIPQGPIR